MKRTQMPIAVIALDVDHFKTYNDNYGHPAGDQVLQQLANVMLEMTSRAGEFAARMGGGRSSSFFIPLLVKRLHSSWLRSCA